MPKIIECSRDEMLEFARKRLLACGYDAFTIRDVAKDCGVSVGTIYSYFSNKETLLTSAIVEEWRSMIRRIKENLPRCEMAEEGMRFLYESVYDFNRKYHGFCTRAGQSEKEQADGDQRRRLQLEQVAQAVQLLLKEGEDREGLSLFIADSILSHCSRGVYPYEKLAPFLRRLFA